MVSATANASNLVINGSFEQVTSSGGGELGYNGFNATGWTTSGYNFLFPSGTSSPSGQYGGLSLYQGNAGTAIMPANSPDGGNFVAADGAFQVGAITQTVTGLTSLQQYTLGFWWAAAQQTTFGCTGTQTYCTTDQWQVGIGSQTFYTPVANTGTTAGGFSGWLYQTFTFTATSSSAVLSFLAVGTPVGQPPFALLDGVTLQATPEPGTLLLLTCGILALIFIRRAL